MKGRRVTVTVYFDVFSPGGLTASEVVDRVEEMFLVGCQCAATQIYYRGMDTFRFGQPQDFATWEEEVKQEDRDE